MSVVISLFQVIICEIWKKQDGVLRKNILPYIYPVCTR